MPAHVPEAPPSAALPTSTAVALLVPLTGANAERGIVLANAAKLALSEPGSPPLDVRDTQGTAEGATAAATAALAAGAGMLLGPLTGPETAAVAAVAQRAGVPVLAFTSDPAQARPGVWTLGITPEQQVRRLSGALLADGKRRIAAALPDDPFGHAMGQALTTVAQGGAIDPPAIRYHNGSTGSINSAIRELSDYAHRRGPIQAQVDAAKALGDTARAAEQAKTPTPPPPFDARLLADTGDRLKAVAAVLPYYDVDAPTVRALGPALWAAPAARADASLPGAWYAGPDPALRDSFANRYKEAYGATAPGLSDLGHDAAAIARVLSHDGGYAVGSLVRTDGFAGVDGVLALQPDGTVRRGLALFELKPNGPAMIAPSPETLAGPGI